MTIDKGDFAVLLTEVVVAKLEVMKKANLNEEDFGLALEVVAKEVEMYCLLSGVLKCELRGSPPDWNNKPPGTIWDELGVRLFEYDNG